LKISSFHAAQMVRKSVPWTNDEHHLFLKGLTAFGKGHWKEISKYYVTTRTPAQVASHAQKYFIRREKFKSGKKVRTSIFDKVGVNDDDQEATSPPRSPHRDPTVPPPVIRKNHKETPVIPIPVFVPIPNFHSLYFATLAAPSFNPPHEIIKPTPVRRSLLI